MRFEKKTPYFALFRHWPDHLQYMSMHSTLVEAFLLVALENNTMSSAYMTCVMAGALMPALTPFRFLWRLGPSKSHQVSAISLMPCPTDFGGNQNP